ncbi:MAG: carbohydrate ABC transporter permease [bacterium]
MKIGRWFLKIGWVYLVLILISIVFLFPIYWTFAISAKTRIELFSEPKLLQTTFYKENYIRPLGNPTYRGYLWNSFLISTGNTILVIFVALLASYALSRFEFSGKNSIFFWTITNRMAPPAAFLLPLYLLYTRIIRIGGWRLFDTRIGLILVYCVFNLPFTIWLLKGIVDAVPKEIDESAMVDGASLFRVIFSIVLPLAAPGIAVSAMLCWIFAWNEYLFASSLTSANARTITTGLAEFVTVVGTNWGEMAAVAIVAMLPSLLLLGLVQRYIITGLTFGAVKE